MVTPPSHVTLMPRLCDISSCHDMSRNYHHNMLRSHKFRANWTLFGWVVPSSSRCQGCIFVHNLHIMHEALLAINLAQFVNSLLNISDQHSMTLNQKQRILCPSKPMLTFSDHSWRAFQPRVVSDGGYRFIIGLLFFYYWYYMTF